MYGDMKDRKMIRISSDKPIIAPEFFDTPFQTYGSEPGFLLLS